MVKEAANVALQFNKARETGIIDLKGCGLMEIPQALFFFVKEVEVTEIDISDNQLKRVPLKLIKAFPKMIKLSIANNCLEDLPDFSLYNLSHLKRVDFSNNKITKFPIGLPSSVEYINFSNNSLFYLNENEIQSIKNCKGDVNLENNKFNEDIKVMLLEKYKLSL